MKKAVLFLILFLVLMTVLPVAVDGGHDDVAAGAIATSSNVSLLGISGLLSLVTVAAIYRFTPKSWTFWRWGVVGLTALSAFIHLGFGLRGDLLLLLNGLGYVGLLGLLVVPLAFLMAQRQWVRWLLLAYTAVTFIGYFALHTPADYSNTGLLTKLIEFILMACIGVRIWNVRTNGRLAAEKREGVLAK